MADYIRRILAKAQFTGNFQSEYPTALIHALLDDVPSEDVRPVVRGKWGKDGDCSVCGCQPWYERDIHTLNYCPACGADMREGRVKDE